MNLKKVLLTLCIILAAFVMACLSETGNPLSPPSDVSVGNLLVDTGFTPGSMYKLMWGEFAAFTLHWNEVENAHYYEIRASETPITADNWSDAILMTNIQAPADSAIVFVTVEVQEEPCIACGLCESECLLNAITVEGGVAVIDYDICTSCGMCIDVCPVNTITGPRVGVDYFFGIRTCFSEGNLSNTISTTETSYKLIFYNPHYLLGDVPIKVCGHCVPSEDSLGTYGGCHIVEDYLDQERTVSTGSGCPVDAIWQDTLPVGPVPHMVYIDYDKCINCGICLQECWTGGTKSVMHRVVPTGWIPQYPPRP